MANADFSQKKSSAPGGFDADSYREAAPEQTAPLTPLQTRLAAVENALPGALGQRALAVVLAAVVMLTAAAGFGGAKLRG